MANNVPTYIFVDTCTMLDSCWKTSTDQYGKRCYMPSNKKEYQFWDIEFNALMGRGEVILPEKNINELVKHANDPSNKSRAQRARYVLLKKIIPLYKAKRITVAGDENDPFADAALLSAALKYRTQKNLIFITQDRGLASDLETVRNFKSVQPRNGCTLKVLRMSNNGRLFKFDIPKNDEANSTGASNTHKVKKGDAPASMPNYTSNNKQKAASATSMSNFAARLLKWWGN